MTLEDFFTLTEMKDGLTAPARVRELVNVMQKEKDCIVKNVGDATRQWSTFASTLEATEDKDCLDLFVQLDGLWFIDRWLKDAQKFGNDTSESFVEESITALLRALEKLCIGYEKSMSYGIWMTVKNLLGHSSSRVQDRARALFDSWKQDGDGGAVNQDVEKVGASHTDGIKGNADLAGEGGSTECSVGDVPLSGEGANQEKHVEPARDDMMPSICSDILQPEKVDDVVETQISDKEKTLDHEVMKDECSSDLVGSVMLKPIKENLSITEESPLCHSEGAASIETCTSVAPKQGIEGKSDVPELNEYTDKAKQIEVVTSPPNKLGAVEMSTVSSQVEPRFLLGGDDAANAQESATEPELRNISDTKEKVQSKDTLIDGTGTDMPEGKSRMDDTGSPHHCRSMVVFQNQGHDSNTNLSLDSSGNEGKLGKVEDPDTSFSTEDSGAQEHSSDESDDLANDSNFLKPAMDAKDPDVVDQRRPDLDLDYSMVDALEVARQVAIEVEREVVDCREPSCSSSEKIFDGGIGHLDSPESIYGKEIQPNEAASKEVPTGPNLSAKTSPQREEHLSSAKTLDVEAENCIQDIESSQVTQAAQEPEVNTEKGLGDFDLNQEVCSEDMDYSGNPISTPISVVSASRAAANPGFPASPLQFEGAHGWKGSAATSAFRPASSRRILEGDKTLSIGGSLISSKQRQDYLDFDLNVVEAGDDKIADLIPEKQIPVWSGLPSGESSIEASPRRSERFKLDLNRISDDGDAPSDWRMEGQFLQHRNGHHSPSPSSSSSSMQPALRNFDLNDQPSFHNDSSDLLHPYLGKSSSQILNASGGLKLDDSVISIMGTRVEVNQKDFGPQTPSLPNGRTLDPALDVNLSRSGSAFGMRSVVPYAHHAIFGYNGLTTGPTITFSPSMYGPAGPIPYMVDSRGAPVVPQIMGSASASPAAYSQPPYIMSMIGTPQVSNGAGPSRPSFDLNSGYMTEGGNRESVGLRQFFNSGQSRSIDEHLRNNSQPSLGSGGLGKRKEPDGGRESYPFNYKHHHQPPWK
ncbi:uncharacterized protein LOC114274388 isoform X1 [Camellia sinensis]|uniref:uncharacterized protein LOC114274388 isoform X1 n=1 Tax=Camellia sinensis TaxID=4442 RepID=UPI0010355A62|nr:uncharacterized protein LOC114274388 isoform X1 [Camellia sinensis]